jgi:hypothetical protein
MRRCRQVIAVGAVITVAGLALLRAGAAPDAGVGWLVPGQLVDGLGMGTVLARGRSPCWPGSRRNTPARRGAVHRAAGRPAASPRGAGHLPGRVHRRRLHYQKLRIQMRELLHDRGLTAA